MSIEYAKESKSEEIQEILNPLVKKWFFSKFEDFSLPQKYAVLNIHNKENTLVTAPTGSGKSISAFLSIINELITLSQNKKLEDKVYCLYVSPLKALNYDIRVNLIKPLEEITKIAGQDLGIRVSVRTGDTSQAERSKMLKEVPHVLITTPESLALMLIAPKFREHLSKVQWVIVDEIHALAVNKRGVDLSLSLERLQNLAGNFTRIGLSATISPLEEVAKYLVGLENGKERDCKVVDANFFKNFDIKVLSPVLNIIQVTEEELHNELYNLLDNLISNHKTTLIFTNTRAGTEKVVHHLKTKFPEKYIENIDAHHSSLSKLHRLKVEEKLREGKLKAAICLEANTKILNSRGEWIKIKDLEEDYVQSINENLKLNSNKTITKITKKNKENLIELKTNLGKEIKCTREHKFLTINLNGELEWKEAQSIKEGEFIATIRNYNYQKLDGKELEKLTFNNYPEDEFVELKRDFLNKVKNKVIKKFGKIRYFWENHLKNECSYSLLRNNLKGTYIFKIKNIKKITKILKIDSLSIYDNTLSVSSGKKKSPKIKITEELMRLLGFMAAEGYISKRALFACNKDNKILNYYRKLIKKLAGRKCTEKLSSYGIPTLIWESVFLSKFLKSLGFKMGRKAKILNIPNFVFRLDKKLIFSFLSGYLDGDGFPEIKSKNNRVYAVGFSTRSKQMTKDLSNLLLREGVKSSIRSQYYNEIQKFKGREIKKKGWFYSVVVLGGNNLRKFALEVNPERDNLKRIKEVLDLNGYCNLDIIPNIGKKLRKIRNEFGISTYRVCKNIATNPVRYELGTRNISRKKFKEMIKLYETNDEKIVNLAKSDIFWEKIKIKKIVGAESLVYNIEVKKDHNYIANGFITKNCSTSLELGLDIGYIDLVVSIGSPKSVTRALQRFGRAQHKLKGEIKGRFIVLDRDDLVECSVMLKNAKEGKIDKIDIPNNCLDVLAQHIYGEAIVGYKNIDKLFSTIRRSYCYQNLPREKYEEILSYLAGDYASLEERFVYAKIFYDKETKTIGKKGKLARALYSTNIGTIPDESHLIVKIKDQAIGMLDERFLERLKPGDIFVLGGSTYQFNFARGMTIQVTPAPEKIPTVPSWFSEMLPLSYDLAIEIQKFRKLMEDLFKKSKSKEEIIDFIDSYLYVDKNAANSIYEYFKEQFLYAEIPHNEKILIEFYKGYADKKYIVFHALFGRRVNDALSRAIAYEISRLTKKGVSISLSDNGFYITSPLDQKLQVLRAFNNITKENIRSILIKAIDSTEILKRRFRHCATRSLMILKNYKGKRKMAGKQQVSAMILLKAVKRISDKFPILEEARREVIEDLMDIKNAEKVLKEIEDQKIKIKTISTDIPSPFALNLIARGYMDVIRMEDKLEFIRRMHKAILKRIENG